MIAVAVVIVASAFTQALCPFAILVFNWVKVFSAPPIFIVAPVPVPGDRSRITVVPFVYVTT